MNILYFVFAALALGILVFIHELGHYFVARKMGMVVEAFSIGFGRPILKWRWQNVDWQLGWLPFGGYVRIKGMELKKKDKNTYIEPYDIPDGFFAHKPYKRILVALAGPVANFILAFLLFVVLFAMGGREKPFSEFTQVIGWVDPQSELYAKGVRPGDTILSYDGKPYTSSKDLLYAAMLGDKEVEIKGEHVNYATGEKTPYAYTIETYPAPGSLDGIRTTGITTGARYLIYDKLPGGTPNTLPQGSPLEGTPLAYGDRLVWADGELLFSMDQLSHILNRGDALLTVKRGDTHFLSRQPRIPAGDLSLPSQVRNEITDWQYEAGIKGKWQEMFILPYNLSTDAVVENQLTPLDPDTTLNIETPLEPGDTIIAIDGVSITTAYQLIDLLQTHHVLLIAERGVQATSKVPWRQEDTQFTRSFDTQGITALATQIGSTNGPKEEGTLLLLPPVEPKALTQFALTPEARERLKKEFDEQRARVEQIRDQERRARTLDYLKANQNKLILGVVLQDLNVDYNPGPFALFGSVFTETYQTLKALILGYLHPKWLSGPVGIVQVIHRGWTIGAGEAIFWIAAISLNLGVLNLLPIPVLDGGYICLSLWEALTRRRLKAKTMERLIIPFVVLLIALLIFLTFQDISRLF